jgi:hypothetical protein
LRGPARKRARHGSLGIDDTPGHGRRTWAVLADEARCMRRRLAIEHIVDRALAIERDVSALMLRDSNVAHLLEQLFQHHRFGMRELDELKSVRSRRIG